MHVSIWRRKGPKCHIKKHQRPCCSLWSCGSCFQIKGQYMQTVGELNTEISSLQEQLRQSKNELKASNIQVADLRRTLEEMKNQLVRKVQVLFIWYYHNNMHNYMYTGNLQPSCWDRCNMVWLLSNLDLCCRSRRRRQCKVKEN